MSTRALITLVGLGCYHGLNPAMGWLFAVALGLQKRSGAAVLRALPPLALGHALAIAAALLLLLLGQALLPLQALRAATAAGLVGFGLLQLLRPRHPRWVGMRVGPRDLTLWSFLMASAHGAGLMLLPLFLAGSGTPMPCHGEACHAAAAPLLRSASGYLLAISLHTAAMLLSAGAVALVVYYKLGLQLLRRGWLNLDRAWAAALILAGLLSWLL